MHSKTHPWKWQFWFQAKYSNSLLDTRLVAIGVAATENGQNFNSEEYSDENNPPGGNSGNIVSKDHSRVLFYQVLHKYLE
jgi:diacylglycerol kinase family enzyme